MIQEAKTILKTVDEDFIENFLGGLEGETISTAPKEEEEKEEEEEEEGKSSKTGNKFNVETTKSNLLDNKEETIDIASMFDPEEEEEEEEGKNKRKPGSFKVTSLTKSSEINSYVKDLIDEGIIFGFDDPEFSVKTKEDLKELLVANREEWKRQVMEEEYQKDFSLLPDEMQYVVEYVKKGGTDLKSLFKVLSQSNELKELDIDKDAKEVVKTYLSFTEFGTEDEIQEQITEWEDLELLKKKAQLFKPKLDKIKEEQLQAKIEEQEKINLKQQELAQKYYESISNTLKSNKINDITLDTKEQTMIYKALTENTFVSTRNGAPINFVGKFLEDITWNKPDYVLLAELALWAKDPKLYKEKIRKQAKEEALAETEKILRTTKTNIKSQELPNGQKRITLGRQPITNLLKNK